MHFIWIQDGPAFRCRSGERGRPDALMMRVGYQCLVILTFWSSAVTV